MRKTCKWQNCTYTVTTNNNNNIIINVSSIYYNKENSIEIRPQYKKNYLKIIKVNVRGKFLEDNKKNNIVFSIINLSNTLCVTKKVK